MFVIFFFPFQKTGTKSGDASCFECEVIYLQEVQSSASEPEMFEVSIDTESEQSKYVREGEMLRTLLRSQETVSRPTETEEKQLSCPTENFRHSLISSSVVKEESLETPEKLNLQKTCCNIPTCFFLILGPLFLTALAILIWAIFRALQKAQ